jgi:hypothetical protein
LESGASATNNLHVFALERVSGKTMGVSTAMLPDDLKFSTKLNMQFVQLKQKSGNSTDFFDYIFVSDKAGTAQTAQPMNQMSLVLNFTSDSKLESFATLNFTSVLPLNQFTGVYSIDNHLFFGITGTDGFFHPHLCQWERDDPNPTCQDTKAIFSIDVIQPLVFDIYDCDQFVSIGSDSMASSGNMYLVQNENDTHFQFDQNYVYDTSMTIGAGPYFNLEANSETISLDTFNTTTGATEGGRMWFNTIEGTMDNTGISKRCTQLGSNMVCFDEMSTVSYTTTSPGFFIQGSDLKETSSPVTISVYVAQGFYLNKKIAIRLQKKLKRIGKAPLLIF